MFKSHRDNRSHASFGGKKPWKQGFSDRNSEKPSFHATCADCGESCTVPFRPNGTKPVLCRSCFGGGTERSSSFGRAAANARSFQNRRESAGGAGRSGDVEQRLRDIDAKLDMIVRMLKDLDLE